MFPDACSYMLFGLLCSQTTLIGYTVIRQCLYEPILLTPLPFITMWVSRYFRRNFGDAARQLSLERAVERDRMSDLKASLKTNRLGNLTSPSFDERRSKFDRNLYRQPVLTAGMLEPMNYRRDEPDPITEEVRATLRRLNDISRMETGFSEERQEMILEESSGSDRSAPMHLSPTRSELV
jgi:hypothetical protein